MIDLWLIKNYNFLILTLKHFFRCLNNNQIEKTITLKFSSIRVWLVEPGIVITLF